jgi:hypothetical protein
VADEIGPVPHWGFDGAVNAGNLVGPPVLPAAAFDPVQMQEQEGLVHPVDQASHRYPGVCSMTSTKFAVARFSMSSTFSSTRRVSYQMLRPSSWLSG